MSLIHGYIDLTEVYGLRMKSEVDISCTDLVQSRVNINIHITLTSFSPEYEFIWTLDVKTASIINILQIQKLLQVFF